MAKTTEYKMRLKPVNTTPMIYKNMWMSIFGFSSREFIELTAVFMMFTELAMKRPTEPSSVVITAKTLLLGDPKSATEVSSTPIKA